MQSTNGENARPAFPSQLHRWFAARSTEKKRVVAAFVPRLNSCSDEGKRGDRIVRTAAELGLPIITFGLLGRTNITAEAITLEPFSSNVHVPLGRNQIEVGLCGGWVGKESHENRVNDAASGRETDMSLIEGKNPVIFLGSPATVLGEPMPLGVEEKPWKKKGEEPWALDGASLLQQAMILGLGPIQILNNFRLLGEISHYYLGDPLAALSMFEWIRHDPESKVDSVTGEITEKGLLNLRKMFSASVGAHALSAVPREAVSLSLARDLFRDPFLLNAFSYYGRDDRRVTFDTLVSQLLGISSLATISLSQGNAVALDGSKDSLRTAYELHWRQDWIEDRDRSSVDKVEDLLVQTAAAAVNLAGASSLVEIDRVVAESLLKALGAVRVNYYEVKREEEVRIRNQWKLDANGGLIERERSELSDSGFFNWVKIEDFRSEIMGRVFARKDEEGQGWQEIFDPTSRDDCARGTKPAPNYPFALFPVVINERLVGVIKLDFTDVRSFAVTGDQRVFIKTLVNQASAQKVKFL